MASFTDIRRTAGYKFRKNAQFLAAAGLAMGMMASMNTFASDGSKSLKDGEYIKVTCTKEAKKDQKFDMYLKPGQKLEGDKKIACTDKGAPPTQSPAPAKPKAK